MDRRNTDAVFFAPISTCHVFRSFFFIFIGAVVGVIAGSGPLLSAMMRMALLLTVERLNDSFMLDHGTNNARILRNAMGERTKRFISKNVYDFVVVVVVVAIVVVNGSRVFAPHHTSHEALSQLFF